MKKLKFNHHLAENILHGEKTSTWRIFDDKDLSVNDEVTIIDKVDPSTPESWQEIGTAVIDAIVEKRLGEISTSELLEHGKSDNTKNLLERYQSYYGSDISLETPVKMINFTFTPFSQPKNSSLVNVSGVTIYADGGSRGNPGPSASGYVIYDDHNSVLINKGIYLGITTNNQAEYTALKLALEEAKRLGARDVKVFMDSLLVINQMKGIFKVKNRDLWPIHDAIQQMCKQFDVVSFTQVPRAYNKLADEAVNQALDKQLNVIRVTT